MVHPANSTTKEPRIAAPAPSGVGMAMRLGTELVVATMIGTAMGYGLDHWLETGPWLTVVFLFFGAAAGFRNAYRLVQPDPSHHKEILRDP